MNTPLLERFVAEARELIQTAASGLLILEKQPDDAAAINNVFRAVHTLKGSAGLFDFPSFIKLVHAGEDVLSVIREGQLDLTADIVDKLLDGLDRVGEWISAIEQNGAMPEGSTNVSKELTAALRALLPTEFGAVSKDETDRISELDASAWLGLLPEADRLDAFKAIIDGNVVMALEYAPAEDCFFSGEDPVNLIRQLPDILSLVAEAREPWPEAIEDLDPYQCVLRFRVLTRAPANEAEHLFRYVIEQVGLAVVEPHQLIVAVGEQGDAAVFADFVDEASILMARADWEGLRQAVSALSELTNHQMFVASVLRWLEAVLSMPEPEKGWVQALIRSIAGGEPVSVPPAGKDKPAPMVPDKPAEGPAKRFSDLARQILEAQLTILQLPVDEETYPGRLTSVSRTVANVLSGSVRQSDLDAWQSAIDEAEAVGESAPALTELGKWLGLQEGDDEAKIAADALPSGGAGQAVGQQRQVSRVLKVDQAKIDSLMNLIGELVVSKNALPFLAKRAEEVYGVRDLSREIKDLHAVVDRLSQEMQEAIMEVRMLPVSEVLDRFPRLVRDVARKLSKRVELVLEGEDTAADKNIVEVLGDPLLHIVRNSLDHGIETPEEREAVGKPALSTLLIRAFHESDQVVIEVKDDGRGIDPDKIRKAAVAKGVLSEERAEKLSDQEAVNLVFAAGFSTAAQVSDLSGRGVGMDVVVSAIEKAGGNVSLTSVKGEGTTARLALPLSMAVTRVMVVEAAGGMVFGIPMEQIVETVRIDRNRVRNIKLSETFVLRDTIVPLVRLEKILDVDTPVWIGEEDEEEAILVVRLGSTIVGLVVDQFREGMDIILKPFDGILEGIPAYSGTALLGDGRVLLVLNLRELL